MSNKNELSSKLKVSSINIAIFAKLKKVPNFCVNFYLFLLLFRVKYMYQQHFRSYNSLFIEVTDTLNLNALYIRHRQIFMSNAVFSDIVILLRTVVQLPSSYRKTVISL